MKPWGIWLLVILYCLLGGWVGYKIGKSTSTKPSETIVSKVDTIVKYDTISIERPVYTQLIHLKERVDTVIDYIIENDTVAVPLSLPLVEKIYSDSTYRAVVSGVEVDDYPRLESIQVYNKSITICETETIIKRKRWGWNIGVQAGMGYGYGSGKISPYLGVGISYGFSF